MINCFQVFHTTFCSNFFLIFVEHLIGSDIIPAVSYFICNNVNKSLKTAWHLSDVVDKSKIKMLTLMKGLTGPKHVIQCTSICYIFLAVLSSFYFCLLYVICKAWLIKHLALQKGSLLLSAPSKKKGGRKLVWTIGGNEQYLNNPFFGSLLPLCFYCLLQNINNYLSP